jgi:hypothetical protein
MFETRKVHVERIHEALSHGRYEVDPAAVADAIVRRMLEDRVGVGRPSSVAQGPVSPAPPTSCS